MKKISKLPKNIQDKLEELVLEWASEYIEGKPIMYGVSMLMILQKSMLNMTNKVLEREK